jgi:Domain of unknown function (DUF5925)/ATPase family associated with various cellular activities (AAA)
VAEGQQHKRIGLTVDVELESAAAGLFVERVLEDGLTQVRSGEWQTSATELALGEPILRTAGENRGQILFERDGTLVLVGLLHGHTWCSVAGQDAERVSATLEWLRAELPSPDPSSAHEVTVTFWTYGPHGPQPSWRAISVPGWEEIRDNYAAATRERLAPLMEGFQPARGGQLVLWHGKAGTGKTFGLRALAWEWRHWCEFHYIVDPDTFFGQHADYLMNVLLQPTHLPMAAMEMMAGGGFPHAFSDIADVRDDGEPDGQKGWKLLMLEDTGELLTADARAVIGQGLSRFLNVVDGLIGQGLRVLVLVTTNEEIRKLHPAVARPGRCAANVEFKPLAADESAAWLERHGVEERVDRPTTLASLYALAEGLDPGDSAIETGFGG